MKGKLELKTTVNRQLHSKLYRRQLEHGGKIKCSYCHPNKGCNKSRKTKSYGGFSDEKINYPNWKLVSKNSKQWMGKSIKIKKQQLRYRNKEYVTISW